MPLRRPSANVAAISSSTNSSSTRVHKTTDSTHGPPSINPPLPSATSATPQQKVVQVLVNRLKNKLPCNSGVSLDRLEADTAIQQTVQALVELSHESVDLIAWALSELLDRLAKASETTVTLPIETLQSQLFILKVLSMVMAARWSHDLRTHMRASSTLSTSIPGSPMMTSSSSSVNMKRNRQYSSDNSISQLWTEPAAMDDPCAKYILSVMVLVFRQMGNPDIPLTLSTRSSDIAFRDFESFDSVELSDLDSPIEPPLNGTSTNGHQHDLRNQPSSNSIGSGKLSLNSTLPAFVTTRVYERTHMSLVKSKSSVNKLIAKFAGRIIFHLSASNWSVVYARLQAKIRLIADNPGDNPDVVDLQLMSHMAFDKNRLVLLLNELSSLMVNMGQEAQVAIAVPLRTTIWNWIDNFPAEFNECIRVRGKTEGAPERVFDLLYSMNPNGYERIFWPLLTILNSITSDRISPEFQMAHYAPGHKTKKELKFLGDLLWHARTTSRLAEVALSCAVDTCRAATFVSPEGEVPLRLIAYDVAQEVKSGFVISGKAFWESQEDIDVALYAEALVAIYRYLPLDESLPLFSACLEAERSDAVKTAAVRACLTLIQDQSRFPWQRSLDDLYALVAPRFRSIIKGIGYRRPEVDQYGINKRSSTRPKAKRTLPEMLSDKEVLALGVLSLFRACPLAMMHGSKESNLENWSNIAVKLWAAPVDIAVKVSIAACLREASDIAFNHLDTHPYHKVMRWLVKASLPVTLLSVVSNLLQARSDQETQRLWMSVAHQIFELYIRKSDLDHVKEVQLYPPRVAAFALSEIAFLVSLASADSSVSQLAARGLRIIAYAERQLGAPVNTSVKDEDRSKRNPIYEQLGDPKILVIGRVGHQKRIRKLVRLISYSSDIFIAVWEECYWRWRSLSESIFDPTQEDEESSHVARGYRPPSQQDLRSQWQNLTLFLAALCGACVQEGQDLTSLSNIIPSKSLPDAMRVIQNPLPLVDAFITDLISSLVVADVHVREVARDALGIEISPHLYGKVLRKLEENLRSIDLPAEPEMTEAYQQFLDQFIAVLKLLAENTQTPLEGVVPLDVSSALVSLTGFVNHFVGIGSFRTKIKLCTLCESVCGSTGPLSLRKDITNARQTILDTVLGWIQLKFQREGDNTNLYNDLNLACLRASVKLLERLQLRPTDSTSTGDDTVHVVSRLFYKYSTALLQCLDTNQVDALVSDSVSDLSSTHRKFRTLHREAETREWVITGLAHLVSGNSESGFKQCLPLAYDQDVQKRTIFAHVFARVIGQGTKFDPEVRSNTQSRHTQLSELVKGSDLVLTMAICDICPPSEADMIISVLLNLFDSRASLMNLMRHLIDREVANTDNEAGLFRSNSTSTRFMSAFARIHGYSYLRGLIQPLLNLMAEMPSDFSYEVDPNRVSEEEAVENQQHVEFVASNFLALISSSLPSLPAMFREICAHIAKVVHEVWPESKFAAMGAFMFLRFISPAVVAPEIVDVEVPKDINTPVLRRGLMVIAKIIQNLANNIFFGKEAHMVVLNKFLESNIANVTRFLSELHRYTAGPAEDDDQWCGTTSDDTDMIVFHRFFDKHADKIGKELLSLSKVSSPEEESSAVNGKRAWDGLCALLVDLGTPLEVPRPSLLVSAQHQEYLELMSRYENRNRELVRDLFVDTGSSVSETRIFVLRLSKIDVETLDIDLLMYHIFKTLSTHQNSPFEIILDCTQFTSISEVPLQWLKYCSELIPADIRSRFLIAHILNPNSLMLKYLRRLYNVSAGTPFCNEIKAYTSMIQLLENIPEPALASLPYPSSLEHEDSQDFRDVTMKVTHLRQPILLQVGTTHLKVTSVKAQQISPGLSCKFTEIIPLMDVSDIYNVSTGLEPYEFIIRRRQGNTIYFSSPSREAVVKTIRSAKGRQKEVQTPLTERFSRFANVPATLLHIGLLSVESDDELRGAAYELLGAVCTYLGYDKNPVVASKSGFIPGDPDVFVKQLSGRLSEFAPQLTLDFIHEVSAAMTAMEKDALSQRINCLQYMSPWVKNLAYFCNPTHLLYERSGARVRDCIRTMSDLSVALPEIKSTIQQHVWSEVAKLDNSVVDVILDELVRTACDGGISTRRCEAVESILSSLNSINVRGRIYSKLRKALSKMPPKVCNNLAEHHNFTEIATLVRLALIVGPHSQHQSCNQMFVPEIAHLVGLVAGEGTTLVRKAAFGIIVNLLQSMYLFRTDDNPGSELLQLIEDCLLPKTLRLFGLRRDMPTSDYTILNPANDKEYLDTQDMLNDFLVHVLEVTSGSRGLLNVWRARWMSLITSTAFQLSPAVQTRSFSAIGALAVSEVDDDFVYQILVALRSAMSKANENRTMSVVSMLRCLCRVIPPLQENSRYVCALFWLAVALLQSSHLAFYIEATRLLQVTLQTMEQQGFFSTSFINVVLMEGRGILEEVALQLDELLRLSFDTSFSFSLASIIFKGMRHSRLKESAAEVLRVLLRVTVRSHVANLAPGTTSGHTLCPDALGYFIALLPVSATPTSYRALLKDAGIDDTQLTAAGLPDQDEDEAGVPRVTPVFLNINDSNTALLTVSFIGTMLSTAQGDDAESQILFGLLSDLAYSYPEVVSMTYPSMQDRIKDTFANASNPNIIRYVSIIFRISHHDTTRERSRSTSTLGEDSAAGPDRIHLNALEELNMQGLANSFQFLPPNRGHATKMINWIPGLVTLIIS